MAIEIPSPAVLRQLQAGFRREAGIPSFDPDDPSLPPLPSVYDAIKAIDHDLPSSMRCDRCGGSLGRDLESTICVYCGVDRGGVGVAQWISFNSTIGCRKLLDYLGLDGSETVILQSDLTSSSKSTDALQDRLALSDLLDMEVRWPSAVVATSEDIVSEQTSPDVYTLNLIGYDIDRFLSERQTEPSSVKSQIAQSDSDRQLTTRNQNISAKNSLPSHSEDFSAFENLRSGDVKVSSSNVEVSQSDNSWDDWEAEFQSASSGIDATDSRPPGQVLGPSYKEIDHDPMHESKIDQTLNNHETSSKSEAHGSSDESGATFSSGNWIQDDHWPVTNTALNTVDQPKHESSDSEVQSNLNNMPSSTEHWFQDDLWPTGRSNQSERSTNVDRNDDFFDSWKDFTHLSTTQENVPNPGDGETTIEESSETKATDLWSTSNRKELDNQKLVESNDDLFDDWQDFTSSIRGQHPSSKQVVESESTLFAYSSEAKLDDLWFMTGKVGSESKQVNVNNDFLDDWPDFTNTSNEPASFVNSEAQAEATRLSPSSGERTTDLWTSDSMKELQKNNSVDDTDECFDDWQDFTGSSIVQENSTTSKDHSITTLFEHPLETKSVDLWQASEEMKPVNDRDNLFDDWQDFTSSNQAHGNLSSSELQPDVLSTENPSETKLTDQRNLTSGNVLQSDPFLDTLKMKKYPHDEDFIGLDTSSANRMNRTERTVMDLNSTTCGDKDTAEAPNTATNTDSTKSKVDKLTSQIPDLSFMLADELSIPEKLNN